MKHKLRINLLASWGDHAVSVLIGFFLMPFVLNTIGDDQYGLWLFICSIAGYSGLLNLGFAETISRFVAHHRAKEESDEINRLASVVGLIYLSIGVAVMGLSGVAAFLLPYFADLSETSVTEIRSVVVLLGANVAIGILGSVFGGVIVGLQRMDVERGIRSIAGLVRLGLTVWLLKKEQGLMTLAGIFLATTLVENLGYALVVFRLMPRLRLGLRFLNLKTLKDCLSFSMFALLDGISGKLIDATDTVVIGAILGTRAIVAYYVGLRLVQFITQPLQLIGSIVMPRGAELGAGAHNDRLRVLVEKGLGLAFLLTAAFWVGAYFFGDHVIRAWVGRSYDESHLVMLVLLGAQIVATPMRVLRGVLFGMGEVRTPALLYLLEAILNLGLSLMLIKPFGVLGVALGTAIPVILVELGAFLPFALKRLQFPMRGFLRSVAVPQLPALLALWAYSALVVANFEITSSWLSVVSVTAGGGVVLGAAWLVTRRLLQQLVPVTA
jgi:O-antigen/teichoic acid export membrane protein